MRHPSRTNKELLAENVLLKQRIRELETAESDYKRSQEELWRSESKYRILFDQATNGIMIMPLDGTNFIINESFAKLHGYNSPKEMEHLILSDLDTPETAKLALERLRRLIAGESSNFEVEHYHKDGHSIFLEVSCNVVHIDGKPHFLGFHNDITARRQAEQAQRKSEELYRTFMDATPDMAFMKDELFRNVVVNESMTLFFDKPEAEIIGKTDFELMPQLAAEKCRQTDMEALVSNSIVISEEIVGKQIFETIKFPVELGRNRTGVGGFIRDITSRKRAEEALERVYSELEQRIADRTKALQESESRFRDLVELIPVVVYETDVNYRLTFANHRAVDLFGYSKEELAGLDSVSMIIPEDRKRLMENFMRRLKGEEIGTNDYIGIKKDGSKFPMLLQSVPIQRNGKLIGARGVVIDITERKQIEDKLQNTLNFLLTLFNTIPSPIFCKDINGLYVDCNTEFEKYVGIERKDIIGKSVYDMYPKDVADKYNEMDLALFRQPGRQIYEYPIIYADGNRHDVVVNKATYENTDGTLAGVVGVMVDITERKQSEFQREAALKELRESEAKLRLLFNSGKDYVAVHLMGKDGQPMNFVQVNDAACEKLGYTREELLNLSPQDIDTADSSGRMLELIEKLVENKQVLFETEMICKNGHRIPMEVSVNLFQLDDNQATMCVARDITDRKQVEQELANRLMFQQTLIDTIPHPIFFKDPAGRFVGCNRAYEREFGITRDYMIGKTVLDLEYLPIDERQRFQEEDMRVIREVARQSYEMPIVYADGQTHITLYSVDGFTLADGNPGGLIGMLVDISERKKAEDELVKYREELEQLVAERTQELRDKTQTLEEVNIALKVLLQHREEDKKDLEDRFVMNVKNLILPYAEKLKRTHLDERQLAYLGVMETNLTDITSSLIKKMHHFNFTPTEIEVASLIKEGKSTKEITSVMGIAKSSVDTHRNNIRKKLGIRMEKVNLRSHLQSFN